MVGLRVEWVGGDDRLSDGGATRMWVMGRQRWAGGGGFEI
jgi:hypothetical protein